MERTAQRQLNTWLEMFQPDVLAPMQYMDRWRRRRHGTPEAMLMYAVLNDAISCFQQYSSTSNRRGKILFREAESWLMVEKGDDLFSFENVCEVLGLDSGYIRAGLMRWQNNWPRLRAKTRTFYVVRRGRQTRK